MYDDLKETIILLMQRPISDLSEDEQDKAHRLLNHLTMLAVDENYTLLDYIQMECLEYTLGERRIRLKHS